MPSRSSSSSSSSSSSDNEGISISVPHVSRTAANLGQTASSYRAESSTASQHSAIATGTPYDTVSIATTNTGFTNATNITANTSVSQQPSVAGSIPIIRPPVLYSEQQSSVSTVNQPIGIDVASAHQQYQQQSIQSEVSPYSGSSTTSDDTVSVLQQQQPPVNAVQAGYQTSGQYQYQQAQFATQLPEQQGLNQLLNAHAFSDAVLSIDYGAMEAYNVGIQSAGDIVAPPSSGNFDAAKAMFAQADANRDGSISREEFRHWAQGGTQPNYAGQSYSNYQTTANYGQTDPQIAHILQQSGLAQALGNYR